MTIEIHYKDQNSLYRTTQHENRTNDKKLKENKTGYLLVYKEGEEKNVNVTIPQM